LADPLFDELNATTLREIYPKVVEDEFFKGAPFTAYLRRECLVPFGGGASMSFPFLYAPMIGGAYSPGDSFNINRVQTLSGANFLPKYYYVAVPEYKELIQVQNRGPLAVISLVDVDLRNAMNTLNAILAIAQYKEGQTAGRIKQTAGLAEAMNDGVSNGYDGGLYTSYGNQARNGAIAAGLNSIPYFGGDSVTGAAGPIEYRHLIETYQRACVGKEEPNLAVMNKALFAYILERIQPQQRFAQEKDPVYGATGFRFMQAIILKDEYAPSLVYGSSNAILGSNLTANFTSGSAPSALSNLPATTTIVPGEVFFWLRTRSWLMRVAEDAEFGFGLTPFIMAQDNTKVVAHLKAAVQLECIAPRLNLQSFGYNA